MPERTHRPATRRLVTPLLLLLAIVALPRPTSAQLPIEIPEPGERLYEVELSDGSSFVARVAEVEGGTVVFVTTSGTRIEANRRGIRRLSVAEGNVVAGEYWRPDRNGGRLFFAPTGRTLPQGTGYFGTSFLVLPFVAAGITDQITLVFGAPITLGQVTPIYLAPKVRVAKTEHIDLSVGSLVVLSNEDWIDSNVGIAFAGGTFGSDDHALSLGLGWGWAGNDFEDEPVAMIGGELRMGPRAKLITENYILPGGVDNIVSFGIRFIGEHLSVDLGLAGAEGGCCLPLLNMTYAFGNR